MDTKTIPEPAREILELIEQCKTSLTDGVYKQLCDKLMTLHAHERKRVKVTMIVPKLYMRMEIETTSESETEHNGRIDDDTSSLLLEEIVVECYNCNKEGKHPLRVGITNICCIHDHFDGNYCMLHKLLQSFASVDTYVSDAEESCGICYYKNTINNHTVYISKIEDVSD